MTVLPPSFRVLGLLSAQPYQQHPAVSLTRLSPEHVETQESLPFDLFDAQGRLLLLAHAPLDCREVRASLRAFDGIYGETHSVKAWRLRLAQAMDDLVRRNAPLSQIARVRPARLADMRADAVGQDEWEALSDQLDAALRDPQPGQPWLAGVLQVQTRLHALTASRMDEALFHFIYGGARDAERYSSRQALRCVLVAGEVARELRWDAQRVQSLERAALTMNVTLRRLQDRLARSDDAPLDEAVRSHIARHGVEAAQLLRASGVDDEAWLTAVALHHDKRLETRARDQLDAGQRLALVLRRVDIYCAKLSCRGGRLPLSAMQAAGQVCMGPDGRPDGLGSVLLKAVGLYPPGSFVQLASDELGVVLSRGARADQPLAAVLVNAQGDALVEPRLRDTALPGLGVRAALRLDQLPPLPAPSQLRPLHLASRNTLAGGGRNLQSEP